MIRAGQLKRKRGGSLNTELEHVGVLFLLGLRSWLWVLLSFLLEVVVGGDSLEGEEKNRRFFFAMDFLLFRKMCMLVKSFPHNFYIGKIIFESDSLI